MCTTCALHIAHTEPDRQIKFHSPGTAHFGVTRPLPGGITYTMPLHAMPKSYAQWSEIQCAHTSDLSRSSHQVLSSWDGAFAHNVTHCDLAHLAGMTCTMLCHALHATPKRLCPVNWNLLCMEPRPISICSLNFVFHKLNVCAWHVSWHHVSWCHMMLRIQLSHLCHACPHHAQTIRLSREKIGVHVVKSYLNLLTKFRLPEIARLGMTLRDIMLQACLGLIKNNTIFIII